MIKSDKDKVFEDIRAILNKMMDDWDDHEEITLRTYIIEDLGFESIDIVILGVAIEKSYQYPLPFSQFLAEVGQRSIRDIRLDELVGFVYQNLTNPVASPPLQNLA